MARSPFLFNTHDLPRRAGEMREYELKFSDHDSIGSDVVAIPKNSPIDVELRITSVSEGVLATGRVQGVAKAECGRCLESIEYEVDEDFTELFAYEVKHEKAIKKKDLEEDEDEVRYMSGDDIDLDGPIRDAVILNLPLNPLCTENCLGLCPDCGEKWADLGPNHSHEKIDGRWAALGDLAKKLEGQGEKQA